MKSKPLLSKSRYVQGLQCPKMLWMGLHQPELAEPFDEATEWRFAIGHRVGELAQQLFPGGVLIKEDHLHLTDAITSTNNCLVNNIPAIFEATASANLLISRVDILYRVPRKKNTWDLYEVKMSGSVKDQHVPDVALQRYCFERAGYDIRHTFLMHINTSYLRLGDLETDCLLTSKDITNRVLDNMQGIEKRTRDLIKVMDSKKCPKVEPGKQCTSPYLCPFYDQCNDPPEDYTIHELMGKGKKVAQLEEMGIHYLREIPPDFPLTGRNARQLESFRKKKPVTDPAAIRRFIDDLEYPLYFLDFETVGCALPLFEKSRPYHNVPFQFSLHIQKKKGAKCTHVKFLQKDRSDPREALTLKLLKSIGKKGSILAWNMSFEKSCIRHLAEALPKHQKKLLDLLPRFKDLMVPFRQGAYSDCRFHGSTSLKNVLPVLVPKLNYGKLNIQEGQTASLKAEKWYSGYMGKEEWKKTYRDLIKYCKLDTLAMVEILRVLKKVCD